MADIRTLAELHRHNVESRPDERAICFKGRNYSYSQHIERARKLANALSAAGCQPGERIAVLAKNCVEYLEVYCACELSGYIIVPLNFRLSAEEISFVVSNTQPLVCFFSSEYDDMLQSINSSVGHFIEFDVAGEHYEQFLMSGVTTWPDYRADVNDPVCIVHTSGTTGRPKGAVLTQGGLYGVAATISEDAQITQDDYGLVMQPLFHVGAKFLQLAHHLQGASINLQAQFQPERIWNILVQEKITTMQLVPTMLQIVLDEIKDGEYPATSLKTIFYSTAPIRESLLRRALDVFGQVFLQQYGSTEGGQVTSLARELHITDGNKKEQSWLLSAGKANPGVSIDIVDDSGKSLPAGEAGEIIVQHDHLMQGYWKDEKASAETIIDGYLHMGDIGYLDEDGFLFIVDRKKDMIISGGENIYPREVEAALLRHPAVAEVAVIGVPDDRWGETVLAAVVLESDAETSEEQLIEFCKKEIASYKKPRHVKFLAALPRIATGKVDKVSLRRPYWEKAGGRRI